MLNPFHDQKPSLCLILNTKPQILLEHVLHSSRLTASLCWKLSRDQSEMTPSVTCTMLASSLQPLPATTSTLPYTCVTERARNCMVGSLYYATVEHPFIVNVAVLDVSSTLCFSHMPARREFSYRDKKTCRVQSFLQTGILRIARQVQSINFLKPSL